MHFFHEMNSPLEDRFYQVTTTHACLEQSHYDFVNEMEMTGYDDGAEIENVTSSEI